MSTCISREGEYSDHQPLTDPHSVGDEFTCGRCFAFREDAAVAEIERQRARGTKREWLDRFAPSAFLQMECTHEFDAAVCPTCWENVQRICRLIERGI